MADRSRFAAPRYQLPKGYVDAVSHDEPRFKPQPNTLPVRTADDAHAGDVSDDAKIRSSLRSTRKVVVVPGDVSVSIEGQTVTVEGPRGKLTWAVADEVAVEREGAELRFVKRIDTPRAAAMSGLSRVLVNNMIIGVTQGYEQTLELVGVGYRAALKGKALSLQLGFSHDVDLQPPQGVTFAVPKQTEIRISGIDKQAIGAIVARIRRIRPPEPYKGKGVRYQGQSIRRKNDRG